MRRVLLLLTLCGTYFTCKAQVNYDASLISKSLLPYAKAVVRNEETTVEIKAPDNVLTHVKSAITILNKNGDDFARVEIWHNKSTVIRDVKGVILDASGKQIKKFSESDFEDMNAGSDYSLFEDSRVEFYLPTVIDYPYTITYDYDVRSKQTLNLPGWLLNRGLGLAVEKSSFKILSKPNFDIRYKEYNMPNKAIMTTDEGGMKSFVWTVAELKALKDEPLTNYRANLSHVEVAPQNFLYEGMTGSFTDWNDLGKWIYDNLLLNRGNLPDATVAKVKTLVAGITDPKEKARKIYEYMQGKTRYISIQVGIGGYQPMLAADVDRLNYGDCKALVNYTKALLKTAGIDSWYCVVKSGEPKASMQPDFSSMEQGDHIILCLPFKNDTTWLECTSQQMPFGFLGNFTDDRLVLACTPEGGKLLHTPSYKAEVNQENRNAEFSIDKDGNLSGNIESVFKGLTYEDKAGLINLSNTERIKEIKHTYPINDMEIATLGLKQDKTTVPSITENIKLTAAEYAKISDNNIFFLINPVNRFTGVPRAVRNRTTPIYINEGDTETDELKFNLPDGYKLDKTPLNVHINKSFASFDATLSLENNQLFYKRTLKVNDGTYSKDLYDDLIEFFQDVAEADHYNVSLTKKTN